MSYEASLRWKNPPRGLCYHPRVGPYRSRAVSPTFKIERIVASQRYRMLLAGASEVEGVWRSRREEDQKTDPDGWSSVSPPHSLKHSTGKRPLAEKDCYENPGVGGREKLRSLELQRLLVVMRRPSPPQTVAASSGLSTPRPFGGDSEIRTGLRTLPLRQSALRLSLDCPFLLSLIHI